MKQLNKTSNECILIKPKSLTTINQRVDNDTSPQAIPGPRRGQISIPDRLSEEESSAGVDVTQTISHAIRLSRFSPELPEISTGRKEYREMERDRGGLVQAGVQRAPSWLNEKSTHKDSLSRHNTQVGSRAFNKRGSSRYNTSTSFPSELGSDGGVFSRLSSQLIDEYYEDSEEEDDIRQLAVIGLSTNSPIRDANGLEMVSLQKTPRKTGDMSAEQVYGGYNSRLPHRLGSFEKLRDSKVYKRTRQQIKELRKVRQWPAGLELSGKAMGEDEAAAFVKVGKDNDSVGLPDDVSIGEGNRLPPLPETIEISPRSNTKLSFSSSFFSDYGLRSNKTNLFSAYKRGRKKAKSASETQLEEEVHAKAERHIYACHVLSSVRRGSKAALNYSSFRESIGPNSRPIRPVSEFSPPKPIHRHFAGSPDKSRHLYDTAKKSPVAFYIKTRDSSDLSRARLKAADGGLPEINGRTLILGMVNK